VGLVVAARLFLPPTPPCTAGRYPLTDVVRSIFGALPVEPSCEWPVLPLKADASWLNSALTGGAVMSAPLIISATDWRV